MSALEPRIAAWRASGELVEIAGHRIFVRRTTGSAALGAAHTPQGGPLLVLLHGFPSSSFDWRGTLEKLPDTSVLTLDFLGFGLSDKPHDVTYSLFHQADIVQTLVGRRDGSVALVGHDMGSSVATELLARDIDGALPFDLASVLLFNGSMILELASLTWAQRALRSRAGPLVARLSNRRAFERQFAALFSPTHPLGPEEAADQWELWRRAGGAHLAHRLVHYLDERETYAERWHGALRDWPGPLRFMWGMHDPVATTAVLDGLRRLRPAAPVTELPDLGHYPQLEAPDRIAAEIGELLSGGL